jgi:hypothetical protein
MSSHPLENRIALPKRRPPSKTRKRGDMGTAWESKKLEVSIVTCQRPLGFLVD